MKLLTPAQILDGFQAFKTAKTQGLKEVTGDMERKLQEEWLDIHLNAHYSAGRKSGRAELHRLED